MPTPRRAQVRAAGDLLRGYYDAVYGRTIDHVRGLTDDDLARIVDTSRRPPVTLGVRLVSVLADGLQHVGRRPSSAQSSNAPRRTRADPRAPRRWSEQGR